MIDLLTTDITNYTQIINNTKENITETLISKAYETQNLNTQVTILLIAIATTIIIAVGFYYLIYKRNEKTKEYQETIKKLETTINKVIELDKNHEALKTREININNLPKRLKYELLEKTNILRKIFSDKPDKNSPYLLYIKQDYTAEFKTNAKAGEYLYKTKDAQGKDITKEHLLTPSKKIKLILGDLETYIWVQYEEEAEPYPHVPKHLSKSMFELIQSIKLAEGLLVPQGGKFPKWIIWLAVLAIVGAIVYFAFFNGGNVPLVTPGQIANNTTEIVSNATKVIQVG